MFGLCVGVDGGISISVCGVFECLLLFDMIIVLGLFFFFFELDKRL